MTEVLNKFVEVLGGEEAWRKLKSQAEQVLALTGQRPTQILLGLGYNRKLRSAGFYPTPGKGTQIKKVWIWGSFEGYTVTTVRDDAVTDT